MMFSEPDMFELMKVCSAPQSGRAASADLLTAFAGADGFPDELLGFAATYRAVPVVCDWFLRAHADGAIKLGDGVAAQLRGLLMSNARRDAMIEQVLAGVMAELEHAGLEAITYKGPTLAYETRNSPELRQADDLDIIVRKHDFVRAVEIIKNLGYHEIMCPPDNVGASPFYRLETHVLRSADGSHDIDLSFRLVHDYFTFKLPDNSVWDDERRISLAGADIRVLPLETLLLFLCVHGSRHLWLRPAWVADIAGLLMQRGSDIDWHKIMGLADKTDSVRMLALGVLLAADDYGADMPRDLDVIVEDDRNIRQLLADIKEYRLRVAGQAERDDIERLRYHLRMRQRLSVRLRYLLSRGFRPSPNDWRAISLPPLLYPLYWLIHPVRLAARLACRRHEE